MRASGVKELRAKVMYGFVYHFGPRWGQEVQISDLTEAQMRITERRLLKIAPPGSKTELLDESGMVVHDREVSTHYREPTATRISMLRVSPPTRQLTRNHFEDLKKRIEDQEKDSAGGMTLEEIRTYRPQ